jgi:branched-chain amino acid transport system substrate-binding protein
LARSVSVLLLAAALLLAGCLSDTDPEESSRIAGDTVTIYSSLPRHGVSAPASAAVAAGQRLALADAAHRAGGLRVRLVRLDSTEAGDRIWNPGRVSANAERAADDDTAIAYIGELDHGASAVSVPITNEAGILQVSPADGLTSLTRRPPGRPRAGPERYYPTDVRTFLRLVPNDLLQAETMLERMRGAGVQRPAVVFDQEIYGRELAGELVARARRDGPETTATEEYRGRVEDIPDIARSLAEGRPDAVVYAGVAGPGTGRLLSAIDTGIPGAPVFATSGLLARDPAHPIPSAPATVEAFTPIRSAAALVPKGRAILRRLRASEGAAAARPEAVYGYEAMRLVLDAIAQAGPDRRRVIRRALTVRRRRSPLGEYTVRATGDIDGEGFALWALRDGRFEYERMIENAP